MERNRYSKIRLILVSLLVVFWAWLFYDTRFYGLNLFPSFIAVIGSILFSLNKKTTDLISFSAFTFVFGIQISFWINLCKYYIENGSNENMLYWVTNDLKESFSLLLFSFIWVYLIFVLIRRFKTEI